MGDDETAVSIVRFFCTMCTFRGSFVFENVVRPLVSGGKGWV
jgi:hypothetical protein